jgi:hypothetical protein
MNWIEHNIFLHYGGDNYVSQKCKDQTEDRLKTVFETTLEAAIKGENDWAQFNVGEMYYYGYGCQQNYTEAIYWYTMASTLGLRCADKKLADMYCYGKGGVNKNYKKAAKRYAPYIKSLYDKKGIKEIGKDGAQDVLYEIIDEFATDCKKKDDEIDKLNKTIVEKDEKIKELNKENSDLKWKNKTY